MSDNWDPTTLLTHITLLVMHNLGCDSEQIMLITGKLCGVHIVKSSFCILYQNCDVFHAEKLFPCIVGREESIVYTVWEIFVKYHLF